MFPTASNTQIITPFGSGYVPEQHGEKALWNFVPADVNEVVASPRASTFGEMLKSLRAALHLK